VKFNFLFAYQIKFLEGLKTKLHSLPILQMKILSSKSTSTPLERFFGLIMEF